MVTVTNLIFSCLRAERSAKTVKIQSRSRKRSHGRKKKGRVHFCSHTSQATRQEL